MITASMLLLAATLFAGPERAVAPPVPESPYSQWLGGLATDGNVALAAWQDTGAVRAARIDRNGRWLDERPLVLAPSGWPPVVARGDGNWLVAWSGMTGVEWRLIGDDGTIGPQSAIAVTSSLNGIDAAFDGTHFLIAWSGHEGIAAVRLDAGGAIAEHSISIPPRGYFHSVNVVAFEGGGFAIVAVQVVDGTGEHTVEAYRLDTNADLQSFGWLDQTNTGSITRLRVLADGDTLVAAWLGSGENLFVAREGKPLRIVAKGLAPEEIVQIGGSVYVLALSLADSTVMLISEDGARQRIVGANAEAAQAASFGDRAVVGITMRTGAERDISTAIVDAALHDVAPPARMTYDPALQQLPAVARNAFGEGLVVWAESGRADGAAVMAVRVDGAGRSVGAPFPVATLRTFGPSPPRVTSDGTDFLVVWQEWDAIGVRAHRVLRDGTVQAAVSIPEAYPGTCVAWNGAEYLIGHLRLRAATRMRLDVEVRATRLSREGVLGETFVVAPEVTYFYSFNCAAGDDATLFTWARVGDVEGALVDDNGTVSGKIHVAATHTFFPLDSVPFPAVTANGNTFLVAWNHEDRSLRWATLNEHGTVNASSEQFPLGGVDPGGTAVAAAPFREGFLLAFGTRDLRALALDRNGQSLGDVSIAGTSAIERAPALAGGNSALAVYLRDTGTTEGAPYWRVFTRTVDDAGPRRRAVRH